MIFPQTIVDSALSTLEQSSLDLLKKYLSKHPNTIKWQIAADYCIGNKERPNDTIVISIVPYNMPFTLQKRILSECLPKDLKKTPIISDVAVMLLRSPQLFHIGFVLPKEKPIFFDGPLSIFTQKEVARICSELSLKAAIALERGQQTVKKFEKLVRLAQSPGFNVKLLSNILLTSIFTAIVTFMLHRERNSSVIGWFSDRDPMTEWCDGLFWDMMLEGFFGLCQRDGVSTETVKHMIGVQEEGKRWLWYDHLIRIPDYIAGVLSAWDINTNSIKHDQGEKYLDLIEKVISDNDQLAIIRTTFEPNNVRFGRVVVTRRPS